MNKTSAKKITALVVFGLAVFAIASVSFAGSAAAAEPTVQTLSASDISDDSAKLNGYLHTNGEDTTYWFEYGTSRTNLNRDTSERDVSDRDGRVTVSNTILNGLISDETYYFRLVAENDDGIARGQTLSFQTDDNGNSNNDSGELTVETLSAQPGSNSAILQGRVEFEGSYVQVWFRYGQSRTSLNLTTQMLTITGSNSRSFSQTASNVIPGRLYYYQAVAQNGSGTEYGDILSFSVGGSDNGGGSVQNGSQPVVATNSALVTGRNSAVLNAQVNPNGTLSSVWFEYGRSASLGSATTRDPAGSGTAFTAYSANLSNLSAGTTYFYRAVSQNAFGTSRGQVLSFRTEGTPPAPPVNPGNGSNDDDNGPTPAVLGATSSPAGAPGCFSVSPTLSSPQLKAGQDFTYSVTYRNNCEQTLSNGSLEITLPVATEFAGTNQQFLSRDGNVIVYSLGAIAPNFQNAVTVSGKVRSQAENGDVLMFEANVTFTDPSGALKNASGFVSATVADSNAVTNGTSTLGASAADALSGLFHSGWFWLVLFLILLALFVFWLATRRRDDDEEEEKDETTLHGE